MRKAKVRCTANKNVALLDITTTVKQPAFTANSPSLTNLKKKEDGILKTVNTEALDIPMKSVKKIKTTL